MPLSRASGKSSSGPDGEVVGADGMPRIGAAHPHQQGTGDHLDRDAQRPAKKGNHEQIDEQWRASRPSRQEHAASWWLWTRRLPNSACQPNDGEGGNPE